MLLCVRMCSFLSSLIDWLGWILWVLLDIVRIVWVICCMEGDWCGGVEKKWKEGVSLLKSGVGDGKCMLVVVICGCVCLCLGRM